LGTLAKVEAFLNLVFNRHFDPGRVDYETIINYMIMIDVRVTSSFNVNVHIIKPVYSGQSYNLFGFVYHSGFLNIFREVASGNSVHVFLATLLRQYGTTEVTTSTGNIVGFPLSFSDGIFEILTMTNVQLGYLFVSLFLPEVKQAPRKSFSKNEKDKALPGKKQVLDFKGQVTEQLVKPTNDPSDAKT
jgi:hypothetical protein